MCKLTCQKSNKATIIRESESERIEEVHGSWEGGCKGREGKWEEKRSWGQQRGATGMQGGQLVSPCCKLAWSPGRQGDPHAGASSREGKDAG